MYTCRVKGCFDALDKKYVSAMILNMLPSYHVVVVEDDCDWGRYVCCYHGYCDLMIDI